MTDRDWREIRDALEPKIHELKLLAQAKYAEPCPVCGRPLIHDVLTDFMRCCNPVCGWKGTHP